MLTYDCVSCMYIFGCGHVTSSNEMIELDLFFVVETVVLQYFSWFSVIVSYQLFVALLRLCCLFRSQQEYTVGRIVLIVDHSFVFKNFSGEYILSKAMLPFKKRKC